jgi:aryl-alcohol dehydrogenase-like predicted oxidoreductase
MQRRDFLKSAIAASVPVAIGGMLPSLSADVRADEPRPAGSAPSDATVKGEMIYRPLGKTGQRVSVIGLGGYHVGMQGDPQESIRIIRQAIDHGVNFMDNCWDYLGGQSEIRMGDALQDGYRAKVFLMSKIDGRTKRLAAEQIDESLKRLKTDRIDLLQHHEVIRLEDPDRIFAPGGAQEAMLEARQAGKIRFIGFTGHKDPAVHLRMLETADKHDFHFDAVQMPLNVMDAHFRSFEKKVLPVLVKKEIGVLGMKSMGAGVILRSGIVKPVECLHYAMSLPTSTVIVGIDSLDILRQNLEAIRDFKPLSSDQVAALLDRTAKAAAEGRFEPFKTTNMYDGTAHNPGWLG